MDDEWAGRLGATDYPVSEIRIDLSLPADKRIQVMAHEVGHAMLHHGEPGTESRHFDKTAVQQEHEADQWAEGFLKDWGLSDTFVREHDAMSLGPDSSYQSQDELARYLGLFGSAFTVPDSPKPGFHYVVASDVKTHWPMYQLVQDGGDNPCRTHWTIYQGVTTWTIVLSTAYGRR